MNLKIDYDKIVDAYLQKFIEKHDCCELEYWIGEPGDIAVLGDYFFNFSDIKYDIDNDVEKSLIWEWYDFNVSYKGSHSINLNTWIMGYRPKIVFVSKSFWKWIRPYILKFAVNKNSFYYAYDFVPDHIWSHDIENPSITELKKANELILPYFWWLSKTARKERLMFKENKKCQIHK